MEGIHLLRASGVKVALSIVSAGYGLIAEDREIVPYDLTFDGMGRKQTRQWAGQLRIPSDVRAAIQSYPLVIFLLSDDYLTAVDPPVYSQVEQRLIFFTRPAEKRLSSGRITIVPAGRDMCSRYHSGTVALKGIMFKALARAVAVTPERWLATIQTDDAGHVIQQALAEGLRMGDQYDV